MSKELFFQRKIKKPLDDQSKEAISSKLEELADNPVVSVSHSWRDDAPVLDVEIKQPQASWELVFEDDQCTLYSQTSFAARMLMTKQRKQQFTSRLDQMLNDLGF